tara:strand:- start:318 stop:737 length:420 start_codon:yes stop_codon:yes gene_type:complete
MSKKDKHNKYYWDTKRNYPYEADITMSVPDGLEFNTPYTLDEIKEKMITRKDYPVYTGVLKYFPDALMELSRVSLQGNKQHHPDKPLHWDKDKSKDHLDALTRHLIDAEKTDDDGILHLAKVAWRALAALQTKLENDES